MPACRALARSMYSAPAMPRMRAARPARMASKGQPDRMLPDPHPLPPADLPARELPIIMRDGPWVRLHQPAYAALHFGASGRNRFDAPDGQFGVMYAADTLDCAFIETFDRDTSEHGAYLNLVAWSEIEARGVAAITPSRSLRLVDITGPGVRRIGADARLATVHDYALPQRWSLALHEHPSMPDGIAYRSRHDPSLTSVALFDRAASSINVVEHGSLADPRFHPDLARILRRYQFSIV